MFMGLRVLRGLAVGSAFALGVGLTSTTEAETIVVDFNDAIPGAFLSDPYIEDGVTMSLISGHYDIVNGGAPNFGYGNIDDVNTGASVVSFSRGGQPFSLVSILFRNAGEFGTLTPSSGAPIAIATNGSDIFFGLSNVTSFTLAHDDAFPGFPAEFLAFDNVTVETDLVPEPSSLLLMGTSLAAAAVAWARRRKTKPLTN
jgi:hypothetical protein